MAERFAKSDRLEEAVEAYKTGDKLVRAVTAELVDRAAKLAERSRERRSEIHALLSRAGAKLPPLSTPAKQVGTLGERGAGARRQVSFTGQVAPLLAAKCGRCHIDDERGGFSLATYERLMQGTRDGGRVFEPGLGAGSVLVESIASGDMPRGGGRVSPAELKMLVSWINQGAKFDGEDPAKNLRELSRGEDAAKSAGSTTRAKPAEMPSLRGNETVSFAADVASLLIAKCGGCHVSDNRGNLSLSSFKRLFESGIVTPRDASGSELVRRLRGESTPRMPLRQTPLAENEVQLIAAWIAEGGAFDGEQLGGTTVTDPLARVAAVARATRATSDELNQQRQALAQRHWRTALSDVEPSLATTDHFLVMGGLPSKRLDMLGQQAEDGAKKVAEYLGKDTPLLGKSRVALFAFDDRLDYSEFGSMVERSPVPKRQQGHWRYDPVDPYACVLLVSEETDGDAFLVTRQVAALTLAAETNGRLPKWLADGAASAIAAAVHPRDRRPRSWMQELSTAARSLEKPTDFMTGGAPPEVSEVIRYGFAKAMLRKRGDFAKLLDALKAGRPAEESIAEIYRHSPVDLANAWIAMARRKR